MHQFLFALKTYLLLLLLSLLSSQVLADEQAPLFTLETLQGGQRHSLQDYRGKVVYLDFWASWCGPCRKSLPALSRLQDELQGELFEVLAINLDSNPRDGLAFLEQYPVSYTVLADRSGKTSRAYDLVGLPTSVLIDKHGTIVASFQGFQPSHIKKLRKAIGYLLE